MFLFDSETGNVTLVSRAVGTTTTAANGGSDFAAISADGKFIVYLSTATNILAGQTDNNGGKDLFLFDREQGTTKLISRVDGTTSTTGNNESGNTGFTPIGNPAISASGRFVAFVSTANDLVAGQIGDGNNVFLFDAQDNSMRLVSRSVTSATTTGNSISITPVISADGRFVAYSSVATDLVADQDDTTGSWDLFLFYRAAAVNATVLVSGAGGSATVTGNAATLSDLEMDLSDDGRFLAFKSNATNLVPGVSDNNSNSDILLFDRLAVAGSNITLVSHANGLATTAATGGFASSETPVISADGRFVAYKSNAANIVAGDANGAYDVFVFDRLGSGNALASHVAGSSASAGADSFSPVISADGAFVAYNSLATNLVASETLNHFVGTDVFLYDRIANTNSLASGAAGSATITGDGASAVSAISGDGLALVLTSFAGDLAGTDGNGEQDVFLRRTLIPKFAFRAESFTVEENAGTARIRVDRTGDTTISAAVDYVVGDFGTARAGGRFSGPTGHAGVRSRRNIPHVRGDDSGGPGPRARRNDPHGAVRPQPRFGAGNSGRGDLDDPRQRRAGTH